jgi:hypothetical protein
MAQGAAAFSQCSVQLPQTFKSNPSENFTMSLETILIIALVVFLLGGGGWYWGRGRG